MEKINWDFCQTNSDEILSEGLNILKMAPAQKWQEVVSHKPGNYLIWLNKDYLYIGEADNLNKRISQQFKEKSSTFYKSYLKTLRKDEKSIPISQFSVKFIETAIGRKELEEFGIVNIPTKLNKFEVGKRTKVISKFKPELWDKVQNASKEILIDGENIFNKSVPINWSEANLPNLPGIYSVFESKGALIYIGESSDINERWRTHSTRTYFSALRRHVGTEILGYKLKEKNKKKRYFNEKEDVSVTKYLNECKIKAMVVNFGRFEMEKYLIKKYSPSLNRKDSKQ